MEQQGPLPLQRTRFRIVAFAQAFPSTVLKNRELATQLGVDPEWIRARCGVHSRYISGPGETTTTLGVRAARQALPPRGTLIVAETLSGTSVGARTADAYFGLYLLGMGSGRARSLAALSQLLQAAGFAAPQLLPTQLPAQLCVVVAKAGSP